MTGLVQAGTPLGDFTLPGTHDSATYGLQHRELSQISYGQIAFLWQLRRESAPANGNYPWHDGLIHPGHPIYDLTMGIAHKTAHSQGHTIGKQLRHGIRYFDLRIYFDTVLQGFYTQHALRGPALSAILDDVAAFIRRCQSEGKQELIFLELSHANFTSLPQPASYYTAQVVQLLQNTLGAGNIYTPPDATYGANPPLYNLSSLYSTPVSQMTAGGPKVIVLNTDASPPGPSAYNYDSVVLNTTGFASSNRGVDGTDSIVELTLLEGVPLLLNQKANPPQLYKLDWTLTMQIPDILEVLTAELSGSGIRSGLEDLAAGANYELRPFLRRFPGCRFNLLFVDWFEKSHTPKVAIARSLSVAESEIE